MYLIALLRKRARTMRRIRSHRLESLLCHGETNPLGRTHIRAAKIHIDKCTFLPRNISQIDRIEDTIGKTAIGKGATRQIHFPEPAPFHGAFLPRRSSERHMHHADIRELQFYYIGTSCGHREQDTVLPLSGPYADAVALSIYDLGTRKRPSD